jgi:hypothetical protein
MPRISVDDMDSLDLVPPVFETLRLPWPRDIHPLVYRSVQTIMSNHWP